jgi:hypothetical protein
LRLIQKQGRDAFVAKRAEGATRFIGSSLRGEKLSAMEELANLKGIAIRV